MGGTGGEGGMERRKGTGGLVHLFHKGGLRWAHFYCMGADGGGVHGGRRGLLLA